MTIFILGGNLEAQSEASVTMWERVLWTGFLFSSKFMLNLNPSCDGIWRWCLWEVTGQASGAVLNGLTVLIKEDADRPLFLAPGEVVAQRCLRARKS
jgi:hypothetical protein